jgi:hypothetical protein
MNCSQLRDSAEELSIIDLEDLNPLPSERLESVTLRSSPRKIDELIPAILIPIFYQPPHPEQM